MSYEKDGRRKDEEPRWNHRRYKLAYICARCKSYLDPDDMECVVCGHTGRPVRKADDE
jgi:rRNA maturation endonuclease Nob1